MGPVLSGCIAHRRFVWLYRHIRRFRWHRQDLVLYLYRCVPGVLGARTHGGPGHTIVLRLDWARGPSPLARLYEGADLASSARTCAP